MRQRTVAHSSNQPLNPSIFIEEREGLDKWGVTGGWVAAEAMGRHDVASGESQERRLGRDSEKFPHLTGRQRNRIFAKDTQKE